MKKIFYLSVAIALAGCSSNDFLDDTTPQVDKKEKAPKTISFGGLQGTTTRAGEYVQGDAAALLGKNFVVEGVMSNGTVASQVEAFDHYNVNWKELSSANTTESNSRGWEYVGEDNHPLSSASAQTIKYWDYSKSQYDFIAFSYGSADKTNAAPAPVLSEMDYSKIGTSDAVYTVTGSAADLAKCYVANLVTAYNYNGVCDYEEVVTPVFRSLGTKVRIAFYEIVPGYSIKNLKFYSEAWDGKPTTAAGSTTPTLFSADACFPSTTSKGTMSVSFPTAGFNNSPNGTDNPDYNQAHVSFSEGSDDADKLVTTKAFSALQYNADPEGSEVDGKYLGRTSAEATYAGDKSGANHAYEIVLPLGVSHNLQLRVEYDLVPIDGGAGTIHVRDANAVIPAAYADWKPNYAYTYIFKISDKTNGWTGTTKVPNPDYDPDDPDDPDNPPYIEIVEEGLTPITFDAVVVDTENGAQETITTVTTPSITTYQEGNVVTSNSEYKTGDIYASVMNGTNAVTLTKSPANCGVLLVTEGEDIITEALAQDMLSGVKANTGVVWTPNSFDVVSSIPTADGNTADISAAKFTGYSGHTYVFYAIVGGKNYVKVIKVQ